MILKFKTWLPLFGFLVASSSFAGIPYRSFLWDYPDATIFPQSQCDTIWARESIQTWLQFNPRPAYDGNNPWGINADIVINTKRGTLIEISFDQASASAQLGVARVSIKSMCGNGINPNLYETFAEGAKIISNQDRASDFLEISLRNHKLFGDHLSVALKGRSMGKDDSKLNVVFYEANEDPTKKSEIVDFFFAEKP